MKFVIVWEDVVCNSMTFKTPIVHGAKELIDCKRCGVSCMDYRKGYLAKFKSCKCDRRKRKRCLKPN